MSNARPVRKRGFTLIEAMAAVVLLGIGIVGSLTAFSSVIRTEDGIRETERMQRMAQAKLAELVATGDATTSTDGDFTDEGEPDLTWKLEVNTSGITDLNAVSLTVSRGDAASATKSRVDTLVYTPPAATGTATGGATP